MAQLYFHCASPERVMPDRSGSALDDLAEVRACALARAQCMIRQEGPEDWRDWRVVVLDEDDETVFELPFASVIGRPH